MTIPNEQETIKPCPFCGRKAEVKSGIYVWFIQCEGCLVKTPMLLSEEDALQVWNRRA